MPRDRSVHECVLAGEETALVRPYVLTAEERSVRRARTTSTWLMAAGAR
ncbi:hypothetical protein [Streptomyces sp. NPDC051079]